MRIRIAGLLRRCADRIAPVAVADGRTHHIAVSSAGDVYIDGAAVYRALLRYKRRNGGRDLGL